MAWAVLIIYAGIFVCVASIALLVRQFRRQARDRARGIKRLEGIADIAGQAAPFGGVFLVQFGNIAMHIGDKTLPPRIWLSLLSGGAAMLLVFGVQLGRLLMRWQLRRLRATLDTESGVITPRS